MASGIEVGRDDSIWIGCVLKDTLMTLFTRVFGTIWNNLVPHIKDSLWKYEAYMPATVWKRR